MFWRDGGGAGVVESPQRSYALGRSDGIPGFVKAGTFAVGGLFMVFSVGSGATQRLDSAVNLVGHFPLLLKAGTAPTGVSAFGGTSNCCERSEAKLPRTSIS